MKHVIWDWNGTLLDDVEACLGAINILLARRNLPAVTVARYRQVFCFPVRRYYEALGFELTEREWTRLAGEYHALYGSLAADAPLRRGVKEALATLRAAGTTLSVLSASEIGLLEQMIAVRGIREYFSHITGLPNFYAQSKLELGHILLASTGAAPEETVLIGDTVHDYQVARALGCHCLLLAGGHQATARLRQCGCPVFSSVAAVLDYIAPAPQTARKTAGKSARGG